jgi:Siderophore-interacting FAD-binding domain
MPLTRPTHQFTILLRNSPEVKGARRRSVAAPASKNPKDWIFGQMRTYSIWEYTPDRLDLAVLDHGDGPGAEWARHARPGQHVAFTRPQGTLVAHPSGSHLLIGERSASTGPASASPGIRWAWPRCTPPSPSRPPSPGGERMPAARTGTTGLADRAVALCRAHVAMQPSRPAATAAAVTAPNGGYLRAGCYQPAGEQPRVLGVNPPALGFVVTARRYHGERARQAATRRR